MPAVESDRGEVIIPVAFINFDTSAVSCVIERVRDRAFFNGAGFVPAGDHADVPILNIGRLGDSAMFVGDVRAPAAVITPDLYRITYLDATEKYTPIGFMYWDVTPDFIDRLELQSWHNINGRWVYVTDIDPAGYGGRPDA